MTTGRDHMVRLWDQNGGKQREFEPFADLALEAVFTRDDAQVVAADWTGEIRAWDSRDGRRLANLTVNPAPIATRIEQTKQALVAAHSEVNSLAKQLVPVEGTIAPAAAVVAQAQGKVTAAEQAATKQRTAVKQLELVQKAKHVAADEARAIVRGADQLAAQATSALAAAENGIEQSAQAEKAAAEALAAAKSATEKSVATKVCARSCAGCRGRRNEKRGHARGAEPGSR